MTLTRLLMMIMILTGVNAAYLIVQHAVEQQIWSGGDVYQTSNSPIQAVSAGRIILDHVLGCTAHQLRPHVCWRSSLHKQ